MTAQQPLIAIVDDDPLVCRAIKRLLRSRSIAAETFSSGREFLDFLAAAPSVGVDCVILDIQMPGLSGFDVQDRLAERNVAVPIVFISFHDGAEAKERAFTHGAAAFLRKPFDDDLLLRTLRRLREA